MLFLGFRVAQCRPSVCILMLRLLEALACLSRSTSSFSLSSVESFEQQRAGLLDEDVRPTNKITEHKPGMDHHHRHHLGVESVFLWHSRRPATVAF